MDKLEIREWINALEGMIDNKLGKWKKFNPVQEKTTFNLQWQFEQTHMILNISWQGSGEVVTLHCVGPVTCHRYIYIGLTDDTFNKVADRVGNLAQSIMHPPIDPMDG